MRDEEALPGVAGELARAGLLRRVARAAGEAFVLRGGMLTSCYCAPVPRVVEDVDFLALLPFGAGGEEATRRLLSACAQDVGDGVVLDAAAAVTAVIWAETAFPGVRARVPVRVEGAAGVVQVDVGFGDPVVPEVEWLEYPARAGAVRVQVVQPETLFGWKVHGLFERGYGQWRPKDLYDLWLLLRSGRLRAEWLPRCVEVAFASRGTPLSVAERFLRGPFGRSKGSAARWLRFRRAGSAEHIPERLTEVIDEVAAALRPVFDLTRCAGAPG